MPRYMLHAQGGTGPLQCHPERSAVREADGNAVKDLDSACGHLSRVKACPRCFAGTTHCGTICATTNREELSRGVGI